MRHLFLLLGLLPALCSLSQQLILSGFTHNGLERHYRIYIPANYDPVSTVPLLLNLHGYGKHAEQQEGYGDFRPIADTAGFIIVHPNGTLDDGGYRFWNAFGLIEVDDASFLVDLIDTISTHYSINPGRVYATGMSNGGMMTHELACQQGERFAAVASVTGTQLHSRFAACSPAHPMPVLQIHGTADDIIPYEGNSGMVSVPSLLDYWIGFNTASPTPVITALPDLVTTDGNTVEHYVHAGIVQDTPVELYKVIGGTHSWPGSIWGQPGTNQDFNASVAIWEFLSRYQLSALTTGTPSTPAAPAMTIAQDPMDGSFLLRLKDPAPARMQVRNTAGQLLMERSITGEVIIFDLPGRGVFMISVVQQGRVETQRVVNPY